MLPEVPPELPPAVFQEVPSTVDAPACPAGEAAITAGFGFGSSMRLHKTDEFSSVFAFRRVLRGRYFALHYCPNSAGSARLGLVVAKKLAKRAVVRNLIKRLGRDVFRHARTELPHYDLVLRLSAKVGDVTKRTMREEMLALLGRLPKVRPAARPAEKSS